MSTHCTWRVLVGNETENCDIRTMNGANHCSKHAAEHLSYATGYLNSHDRGREQAFQFFLKAQESYLLATVGAQQANFDAKAEFAKLESAGPMTGRELNEAVGELRLRNLQHMGPEITVSDLISIARDAGWIYQKLGDARFLIRVS